MTNKELHEVVLACPVKLNHKSYKVLWPANGDFEETTLRNFCFTPVRFAFREDISVI